VDVQRFRVTRIRLECRIVVATSLSKFNMQLIECMGVGSGEGA